MDSDCIEHNQFPHLARTIMGIRQSHATDELVCFYLGPIMPTLSRRKAACHTDMEDIKDDNRDSKENSSHK